MKIETVQDRREYLVAAIADIGEQMKGPMPNFERMMLHEERKDLRAELAKMGEK